MAKIRINLFAAIRLPLSRKDFRRFVFFRHPLGCACKQILSIDFLVLIYMKLIIVNEYSYNPISYRNIEYFMIKECLKFIVLLLFVSFIGYNVYLNQKGVIALDLSLESVEAIADPESEWGCAGHPTWIPNYYLGTANCWDGGTHKKCKEMTGVCCNPAEQTDCQGIDIDIL